MTEPAIERHRAAIHRTGLSRPMRLALRAAWTLSRKVLVVSARLAIEVHEERLTPYGDGGLTRTQTFQKYYAQRELSDYIESTLGIKAIADGERPPTAAAQGTACGKEGFAIYLLIGCMCPFV